ncbi:GltJ protein [Pararhodospirillum photometricum]|uniref:GltJ protein n=1 Tax=Pararhodospirillum photometricum DSM 122 TaxID=1150469 RepID=H6SQ47_PARPM|nr:GltJ protein [Pararhodospirillum photometricum]CCG09566.1 GltJ protein [Pararhodospirillum photometricum DSM 122]
MSLSLDWAGVLQGPPANWLVSGFVMTLAVSLIASLLASVLAVPLLALRLSPVGPVRGLGRALISAVRDSPLLVQMFFGISPSIPWCPAPCADGFKTRPMWLRCRAT